MPESPPDSSKAQPARKNGVALEEARLSQQAIGVKLRHMFDEVINEPVPDEFLDILRKADTGGDASKSGEGA